MKQVKIDMTAPTENMPPLLAQEPTIELLDYFKRRELGLGFELWGAIQDYAQAYAAQQVAEAFKDGYIKCGIDAATSTRPSAADQTLAGVAALLGCTQTEVGDLAPKLYEQYTQEVARIFAAMTKVKP